MSNTAAVTPAAGSGGNRRWLAVLVGVIVLTALGVFGVILVMLMRMSAGVPADLDYAATRLSEQGLYRVTYAVSEAAIPINRLHTWTLHVESAAGQPIENAQIAVDGDMPQHGHGLPTRPQVTQNLGGGDYLVEGMKFQMGGWWVMDFDITADGQSDRVSFNLMLK